MAETLFHFPPQIGSKRPALAGDGIVHASGCCADFASWLLGETPDARQRAAHGPRWRCHHLFGDPVRFLLQRVAARANGQFGLQSAVAAAFIGYALLAHTYAARAFALQEKAAPRY